MVSGVGDDASAHRIQGGDRAAFLDGVVASTLEPVAGGLAVLFLAVAAVQRFLMAPPFPGVMAPYSVATSAVFGAIYAGIRSRGVPPPWAHAAGTVFVLLVLVGTILPFALVQDPLQTTDLVLLALGTGVVFVSRRWYALNLAILVAVFGGFVAANPSYGRWPNLGVAVMSASVLGYVVLRHRVRILTSLHELRVRDARRQGELEDRMARIERLRERAERERDRAKRYASQVEESNQDLERFAETVSRHLQAPVSRARQQLGSSPSRRDDAVVEALQELQGMEATLEALLDYAGISTWETDLAGVDLEDVVARAWRQAAAEVGLEAERLEMGSLPEVVGDEDLLVRLFRELLENALRHGEPPVVVEAREADGAVRVAVEDQGPGVDPDDRDRIFRLLASGDGTRRPGVGLAICRRAAERVGGHVAYEPGPEAGARFLVTLRPVGRIGAPAADGGRRDPSGAPDRGNVQAVGRDEARA